MKLQKITKKGNETLTTINKDNFPKTKCIVDQKHILPRSRYKHLLVSAGLDRTAQDCEKQPLYCMKTVKSFSIAKMIQIFQALHRLLSPYLAKQGKSQIKPDSCLS